MRLARSPGLRLFVSGARSFAPLGRNTHCAHDNRDREAEAAAARQRAPRRRVRAQPASRLISDRASGRGDGAAGRRGGASSRRRTSASGRSRRRCGCWPWGHAASTTCGTACAAVADSSTRPSTPRSQRMRELGYLNDAAFARFWVESRQAGTPRSRRALAFELQPQGRRRATMEAALEGVSDAEAAYDAAQRRLRALRRRGQPDLRAAARQLPRQPRLRLRRRPDRDPALLEPRCKRRAQANDA